MENGTKDVFNFEELDHDVQELINAAIEARTFSYCPYSKFPVGAALRTTSGEIISGCNVENVTFGASVCAERMTFCKAISSGFKSFTALAVVAYQENSFTTPCGICRQFIAEFASSDFPIYVAKPKRGQVLVTSVFQLNPFMFNSEGLLE